MKDEDGEIVKSSYEMPKLALLPDLQSWMHFTFSANWKPKDSESYMRIDFPEQHLTIKGSYSHLKNPEVYIGIGSDKKRGFNGDIREVWVSLGYLNDTDVPKIMNMNKVFDVSTMGYYKFPPDKKLNDAMRFQ